MHQIGGRGADGLRRRKRRSGRRRPASPTRWTADARSVWPVPDVTAGVSVLAVIGMSSGTSARLGSSPILAGHEQWRLGHWRRWARQEFALQKSAPQQCALQKARRQPPPACSGPYVTFRLHSLRCLHSRGVETCRVDDLRRQGPANAVMNSSAPYHIFLSRHRDRTPQLSFQERMIASRSNNSAPCCSAMARITSA